jgi:hypothetical protein
MQTVRRPPLFHAPNAGVSSRAPADLTAASAFYVERQFRNADADLRRL